MTQNLIRYINKTVMISIPALSGDAKCRPYMLTGVELVGLWLRGDELVSGFLAPEVKSNAQASWGFFVPYSQIACIAVGGPVPASSASRPAAEGSSSGDSPASRKKTKTKDT
jgi:hypothetical protein